MRKAVAKMNKVDIANYLIFKKFNVRKDTFDERLLAQKKMYLLQEIGTNLGYHYNWYLHGPYSPSLTTYIYNNLDWMENSSSEFKDYKLSQKTMNNIQKVLALANRSKTAKLSETSWYELLASLYYIKRNKESWGVKSNEDLFSKLLEQKPQYTKEQCQSALIALNDCL